ncbi:MAG TPA: bifunctional transaldolase/phosoglucose isomerase, partial [Thermomicrobiaceae bacterium]|nr:bifunctional transaldolase/phosoglucose isomerase [Thermomicrobiaceae bacterium]
QARLTIEEDVEGARHVLEELANVGVSYDDVTHLLQVNGVAAFAKSYDSLIRGIDEKRQLLLGPTGGRSGNLGPFDDAVRSALDRLAREHAVDRTWRHDATLWGGDAARQRSVANRLGWLTVHETMLGQLHSLNDLQADVRSAGFTRALLLGMGGSSLAPEVFQRIFGSQDGFPELQVVDTTDPDAIEAVTAATDLEHALFIVSSKSGTTVETSSLFAHFDRLLTARVGADESARHFVAVTDPGTKLEELARERGFRHLFLNPADIGGRYSALSCFGLVPAAIIGLDVKRLLEGAAGMAGRLKEPGDGNPGLWLGAALGALAQAGHDKVTFVFDPALESLAAWLEQLLAESTGKDGTGLVPIANEPQAPLDSYGADRVFVGLDLVPQPHAHTDAFLEALEREGQPVIRLRMTDEWQLGAEFLRWEFATAVAGIVLGINPFDEPNVQESKDNTNRLLAEYRQQHRLPEPSPVATTADVGVVGVAATSVGEAFERFVAEVRLGDYLAIMAFMPRTAEAEERLQEIRGLLCERLGVATTLGFGPRFLHSTGQLYKGGPAAGTFLQVVVEPQADVPIPGQDYSFGTLFRAQALGDYQALERRGRPLLRLTMSGDPEAGLRTILQALAPAAAR